MSEQTFQTLGEFIIDKQDDFKYSTGELSRLLSAIRLASKVVNREVNKAGIAEIIGHAGNQNVQGEDQQKLDVLANNLFIEALSQREVVCGIASEESDDFIEIKAFFIFCQIISFYPSAGSSHPAQLWFYPHIHRPQGCE